MANFQRASAKFSIASTWNPNLKVEAQFNPKELQVDKSVPWQKKSQANQAGQTGIQLEFTGAEGRSLTLELLFDGFETKKSVAKQVDDLNWMASVIDPKSTDESQRRPEQAVA